MGITTPSLLTAKVMHKRLQPRTHSFTYNIYYLCFPIAMIQQLKRRILSIGRFNLFSYYEHDHGKPEQQNEDWIRGILQEWKLDDVIDGNIMLITMPRILGYAFNPVSFWFCLDKKGDIRAVLSEVNNTFGEKHCYLSFHDDKRPIAKDDWMHSQKVFHVSPFMTVEGSYHYRFILNAEKVAVWINHETDAGMMLHTSLIGSRIPLTSKNLLVCFFRFPLVTCKVIALIHWHAFRLFIKKIRYHTKPTPPLEDITR